MRIKGKFRIFATSNVPINTSNTPQSERDNKIKFTGATHLTMCYNWLRCCFQAPYFISSKTATL